MQGNHAIKFHFIAKYFKNDERQLSRGENSYTSGHVKSMQFNGDVQPAFLKGEVQASMKKRNYKVEAHVHLTEGIASTSCTCPRGQGICHHMAALLYYAHYNISSTDKAREWGPTQSKKVDAENTSSIEQLYPREEFTAMVEDIDNSKIETFRKRLGHTNVVGFSWYLKPEAENIVSVLVPPIDEILFSEQYLNVEDKDTYLIQKCSLDVDTIKEIAAVTVGQHKNEGWLVSRKMRLTGSKFGAILSACRRNKYPKSLFKSLMEGYNLNRVLAKWGKDNEETALKEFVKVTQLEVTLTGLWLHESGILGASPDGLINDDAILEIKCPYKFRKCSIKDGVADKKYFFYYEDGEVVIRTNHMYYDQIQAQLCFTKRDKCYFFVWTPTEQEVLLINKDPDWEDNIHVLINFYFKQFIPAIFDMK